MNNIIYRQYDYRWAAKPYPVARRSTVGGCGCGLLACTHIAMEQEDKKNWTPENLRPYMVSRGFAIVGQGTTWDGITETLKHIGHEKVVRIWNDPMTEAFKELNKGNRIGIILFGSTKGPDGTVWTGNGHYIAFTSYKYKDGKHWFYLKDSGGRMHDGWYSYEKSMRGDVRKMWIVERVGTQVTSPKATTSDGKLVVDGIGGVATVKAMQKFFGVAEDGVISGQNSNLKRFYPAFKSVSFENYPKGSPVIKMMQKNLGISPDGILGKTTVSTLQKFLGVSADGVLGAETMKAWQLYLNNDAAGKPTPSKKETKPEKVKANATKIATKADMINSKALEFAWPAGTHEQYYRKKGGSPNSAFKAAWKHYFPRKKINTGCHSYVMLVLRACGYPTMSLSWSSIFRYMRKHFKEIKVNYTQEQLKPGDIRIHKNAKGGYHIWIIVKKGNKYYRAEANQAGSDPRYAHLNGATSGNTKKHNGDWLFRAK